MAKPIHTINITYTSPAGQITIGSYAIQDEGNIEIEVTVPATTVDKQVDIGILLARLKSFCIISNKAITVEGNSGSAPDGTLSLATANRGYAWNNLLGSAFFVEETEYIDTLESLFITNAGDEDATVIIRALVDTTPA
jgi:hypothetical protein